MLKELTLGENQPTDLRKTAASMAQGKLLGPASERS